MAVHDSIGDMLTKIRNASSAGLKKVFVHFSKEKWNILSILYKEGFLKSLETVEQNGHKSIVVYLKYHEGRSVIRDLQRISKPGRRVYRKATAIPRFMNGLAVTIVSTSKGVFTGKKALEERQGGEVICYVY